MTHATRESWLAAAVDLLRPAFAGHEYPLPEKIRVSCGWPSKGGTSPSRTRLGECWNPECSQDGHVEIFVSPRLPDGISALGVLVHELVHAALFEAGNAAWNKHTKPFAEASEAVGLEAPWKESHPGPTLTLELESMIKGPLGEYPASPLTPASKESKKQTTRMLKCACPKCGYTLRTTQKWIDVAVPYCPADETRMIVGSGPDGITETEVDRPLESGTLE